MRKMICLAAALSLLAGAGPLAAEDRFSADRLREGKKRFEDLCSRCHGLDRPLAKELERGQWEIVLAEMAAKGAEVSPADRGLIVDYLGVRSVFLSRCTVCHTKEKVFDREKTFQEWTDTVVKMAAQKPGLMTDEEVRSIVAYLIVVLGTPPGGK